MEVFISSEAVVAVGFLSGSICGLINVIVIYVLMHNVTIQDSVVKPARKRKISKPSNKIATSARSRAATRVLPLSEISNH